MPEEPSACPDSNLLGAFHSDRLSGREELHIAEHIEVCATCAADLAELSLDDRFADDLAQILPDGPPRAPLTNRRPPQLDGVEVYEELGHGGMGRVWRGRDAELGRVVAVKILHEKLAAEESARRRFVTEARITGQLQHPGIVPVYRLGVCADGRPYLLMKLVKGRTLAEILLEHEGSNGTRPELLHIFQKICEALSYAHSRGVIHRDIKPSNVMVGPFGEVQVLDWGLAKVLNDPDTNLEASVVTPLSPDSPASHESVAGTVMGTPSYMAPEQASGMAEEVSQRSDVFSLGGILYELLTGRRPNAKKLQDVYRHLKESRADRELVQLTRSCLALNPEERPAHAGHVARAVSNHQVSVERRAHRAEVVAAAAHARSEQERKARRRTVALGGALLLAVLVACLALRRTWRGQVLAAEGAAVALAQTRALFEKGDYEGSLKAATHEQASRLGSSQEGKFESLLRDSHLMARVVRSRIGEPLAYLVESDTNEIRAELRDAFREYGIDVLAADTAEAAHFLKARGVQSLVRPVLEGWTVIEFQSAGWRSANARRLLNLASALDDDPTRQELREIIRDTQDRDELRAFMTSEHVESLEPSMFVLVLECLVALCGYDEAGNSGLGDASDILEVALLVNERYPNDVRVLTELATAAYYQGEREYYNAGEVLSPEAVSYFHEAIEYIGGLCTLEPERGLLWAYLGGLYIRLGDRRRSDALFSRAMQSIRVDTAPWNRIMSEHLLELDATDRVIKRLSDLLDAHPGTPSLWSELAYNLCFSTSHRDMQRALEAASRAVELDPEERYGRQMLGFVQYHAGNFAECADTLSSLIDAGIASDDLGLMRAVCLHELGRTEEAGRLGRRMLRRIGESWTGDGNSDLLQRGRALFER